MSPSVLDSHCSLVMWSELVNMVGQGYDGALNSTCLGNVKKDICAKMYLPCTNITLTVPSPLFFILCISSPYNPLSLKDNTTWNYVPMHEKGGITPLPYHRPCRSTCEHVSESCGTAGEVMDQLFILSLFIT